MYMCFSMKFIIMSFEFHKLRRLRRLIKYESSLLFSNNQLFFIISERTPIKIDAMVPISPTVMGNNIPDKVFPVNIHRTSRSVMTDSNMIQ
jgi:hypothetical protein